ncbi:hypothetical protein GCM10007989_34470 [Devosia pacifica]|uniref:FAD-binding FR-type domain-containing protein n=1 Tax=Devosia pacifica TaxID=1335967 RepID=A0A918SEY4_9HYPH|nr:FAD-dependent oxidoreductase [Devosia pacifica]GHA35596.1 hypothetical protein GCM10007989_34470 [Devosia pacifica]
MIKLIHPIAGMVAILTIATFWLSTIISEVSGSNASIVAVKSAIPWGFLLLVPALAAVGGSGFVWSRGQQKGLVGAKLRRMPIIAANGILVLIPSALFLSSKAQAGEFDAAFYGVQALELVSGAINLTLLGLSMRDGLRLSQWRRKSFLKPSTTFASTLAAREAAAKGTSMFYIRKPAGFQFKAGQAIYLTLPSSIGADHQGRMRTFSLSSTPHDADLTITTRLGNSAFKKALEMLPLGTEVEIDGPYGDMTLDEDTARPAVFIAGGVGVTPFRSMIHDALDTGLPQKLVLFYSMRSIEEAAFLNELAALADRHTQFKLVTTVTGSGQASGSVERGHITADMVTRHTADLVAPVYYVAGPPGMVESMQTMLTKAGISDADIRTEAFSGY